MTQPTPKQKRIAEEIAARVYSKTWGACETWPPISCPKTRGDGECACQTDIDMIANEIAVALATQSPRDVALERVAEAADDIDEWLTPANVTTLPVRLVMKLEALAEALAALKEVEGG